MQPMRGQTVLKHNIGIYVRMGNKRFSLCSQYFWNDIFNNKELFGYDYKPSHSNRVTATAQYLYVPQISVQVINVVHFCHVPFLDYYIDTFMKSSRTVLLKLWQSHFVTLPGQTQSK